MTLAPKLVDPASGELFEWAVGAPISAVDAAEQLPLVTRALHELSRIQDYLREVISLEMTSTGKTEWLAGATLYQLKADSTWVVDDPGALFQVLHDAVARNEITRLEFDDAVQQSVSFAFHHGKLNALARRLPRIEQLRRRVEGTSRLRQKR